MYDNELTQANLERLNDLRSRFASLTDYVAIYQSDWRAMAESGAVASIHIARYRGQKPLTASDLGLGDLDLDQVNRVIDLGERVMLPKAVLNQFNSLEARARQVLRRYCLGTPFGLFLPASAYNGASTALGEYKARFDTLVADLLARLPEHKTTMLSEYAQLAYQVIGKEIGADNVTSDLVDAFVDRCMADFPSEETLQRSFAFGLRLEFIPALAQDAQVESPSYAQASADLIAMRRAMIADQREARAALVDGFIGSVQSELFNLVNTALGDIYAALTKENSESLPSRNVVQIKNLVKTIGDLNFWSDKRLEVIQAEIMTLLPENRTTARRDMQLDASLVATLQDETKAILLRLNGSNRTGFEVSEPSEAPAQVWTRTERKIDLPSEAPAQDAPQAREITISAPVTVDELYDNLRRQSVQVAAMSPQERATRRAQTQATLLKLGDVDAINNQGKELPEDEISIGDDGGLEFIRAKIRTAQDEQTKEYWIDVFDLRLARLRANPDLVWDGATGEYITKDEDKRKSDLFMARLAEVNGWTVTQDEPSEAPRVLRPATDQDREYLSADSIVDGNVVVTPITRADVAKRRGARLF